MGGVATEFGGVVNVVYHFDDDRTHLETVLTAAVAWRPGHATASGWGARIRRWQFHLGLHPLNRRFSIGREAGLWYGSSGAAGECATMFHPSRNVVRVLGREYQFAQPARALVLLIDETGQSSTVRAIQIPAPRLPRTTAQLDPAAGQSRFAALTAETVAWRDALRTHAEIAAFLGGSPT